MQINMTTNEGWDIGRIKEGNRKFQEYVQTKIALERLEEQRKAHNLNVLGKHISSEEQLNQIMQGL